MASFCQRSGFICGEHLSSYCFIFMRTSTTTSGLRGYRRAAAQWQGSARGRAWSAVHARVTRSKKNHTAILIIIYSPWKAALFIKMTSAFHTALCSSWRCSNRDNAPFSTYCHRRISSGLDRHMHHTAYISECTAGTSSPPPPHVADEPGCCCLLPPTPSRA